MWCENAQLLQSAESKESTGKPWGEGTCPPQVAVPLEQMLNELLCQPSGSTSKARLRPIDMGEREGSCIHSGDKDLVSSPPGVGSAQFISH